MTKKKNFSKKRAKVRYHNDPEYAARIKKASRESHKKARDARKAAKEAAADAEEGAKEVVAEHPELNTSDSAA
jgi:type IV secretory pathway TraG/TraD family ATPase VirD4